MFILISYENGKDVERGRFDTYEAAFEHGLYTEGIREFYIDEEETKK